MDPVDPVVWRCPKWADCSCCQGAGDCGCGETCSCGSVPIQDVTKAMDSECPKADCECGNTCSCGKGNCATGSVDRTQEQWVEHVRAKMASPEEQ